MKALKLTTSRLRDFASSKSRSDRTDAEPESAADSPPQDSQAPESLEPLQPTQSGADAELERAFFSRGLSNEALTAVSEHQDENEVWHHTERAGRRRSIGIAVSGALVLVTVAVGVRGLFADRVARFVAAGSSEVAPAPLASVKRVPARVPTPESVNAMPLELVPPISSEPRLVTVDQLRARLAEGPALEPGPSAEQSEQRQPLQQPRPQAIVAAPEDRTETTDGAKTAPAVAADRPTASPAPSTDSPTATAIRPVTQINGSTPGPAMDACAGSLRSGRFRDIDAKCRLAFDAQPAAGLAAEVAQAALEHGRNADAVTWARRAIGADPKLANAFVLLGGAEQQLGHPAEARAAYARYLELAPDGEHARDVRALLPSLAGM